MRTLSKIEADTVVGGRKKANLGPGGCSIGAYGTSILEGSLAGANAQAGEPAVLINTVFDPVGSVIDVSAGAVAGAGVGALYQTNVCVEQTYHESLGTAIEHAAEDAWNSIVSFFGFGGGGA